MRRSRFILVCLLGVVAMTLSGCVWLRLLSLKKQLADFDRYVLVEDTDGLTLRFNKPVLHSEDLLFLMSLEPTRRVTNGATQTWDWTFRKLRAPDSVEQGDFDLIFSTEFVGNRLTSFSLDDRFLASLPKPLLLGALRSFGQADVDQKRRTATMRWVDRGENPAEWQSLSREALTRLLGEPYALSTTNAISTSVYRYRLDTPSPKSDESLLARVEFSFLESSDKLTRVDAAYGQFKIAYEPSAGRVLPPDRRQQGPAKPR